MTVAVTPPGSPLEPTVVAFALALADDEMVLGHRHSEWLGLSPFLEEDLATASIAQDEMGHARGIYAVLWPDWVERDALVTMRVPDAWRSCRLVESGARVWEQHLVRHLVYDLVEQHRWDALVTRSPHDFATLAERAGNEERWHRRHATELIQRLSGQHSARLQNQLEAMWPFVGDLFHGFDPSERSHATSELARSLDSIGLRTPTVPFIPGDRTRRSAPFAEVHLSLTEVASLDPSATW